MMIMLNYPPPFVYVYFKHVDKWRPIAVCVWWFMLWEKRVWVCNKETNESIEKGGNESKRSSNKSTQGLKSYIYILPRERVVYIPVIHIIYRLLRLLTAAAHPLVIFLWVHHLHHRLDTKQEKKKKCVFFFISLYSPSFVVIVCGFSSRYGAIFSGVLLSLLFPPPQLFKTRTLTQRQFKFDSITLFVI